MEYGNRDMMQGQPASEKTEFTMRTIKDILREEGKEDLLLTSSDTAQESAAPDPRPAQTVQQPPHLAQNAAPSPRPASTPRQPAPEPSLTKKLSARLFGRK